MKQPPLECGIIFPQSDAMAADYFRLSAVRLQFEGSHNLKAATIITDAHVLAMLIHYIIMHMHVTWVQLMSVHLNGITRNS